MNESLHIQIKTVEAINFALQQNNISIIRELIIENNDNKAYEDLEVKIISSPSFTKEYICKIDILPAEESIYFSLINLVISTDFILSLTEKIKASIKISVHSKDQVLGEEEISVDVLPHNQWVGYTIMPETLASFSLPNHPLISKIIINAASLLEKWGDSPSFTAYQDNNKNIVRKQIAAIYGALQIENIIYVQSPPSFETMGQRIRLLDSILKQKQGNCLDLSLLFAACLEAIGLNPLIILTENHAFVGCWLEDEYFSETLFEDKSILSKRTIDGLSSISLIESTSITGGQSVDFSESERLAIKHLETENFLMGIDVTRARISGIYPLPIVSKREDGTLFYEDISRKERKEGITEAPDFIKDIKRKESEGAKVLEGRLHEWSRKLLDLSLRNTLLNFRVTRSTIQLLVKELGELEDAISGGDEFRLYSRPQEVKSRLNDYNIFELENNIDNIGFLLNSEFEKNRLRTYLTEAETNNRMTHLYRTSRTNIEENGANTLFLALGFLKWYESESFSERPRYAPLILIPVEIIRKSGKVYHIRIRDEDVQINITLLEMLEQNFDIIIKGLDPIPEDDSGVDLDQIFHIFRQAIIDKTRWDIENLVFLGIFSFGQFIMWNDLYNRSDDLKKNKVVSSLIERNMTWNQEETFISDSELDKIRLTDIALPTNADSSQLKAILAASANKTFIVHGPPGTGKSQTITNIIANALYRDKSVLFVAEKMAALSVVQKRLTDIGIGHFALELHSNKASKRHVLGQLESTLNLGHIKSPDAYEKEAETLEGLRNELNELMEEIHKKKYFDISLYDAILYYEDNKFAKEKIVIDDILIDEFTTENYRIWINKIEEVLLAAKTAGDIIRHPLKEIKIQKLEARTLEEIRKNINDIKVIIDYFKIDFKKMFLFLEIEKPKEYSKINSFAKILQLISESKIIPKNLYEDEQLGNHSEFINNICQFGKRRDTLRIQLDYKFNFKTFNSSINEIVNDWNLLFEKPALLRFFGQSKILKRLNRFALEGVKIKRNELENLLSVISEYRECRDYLHNQMDLCIYWFGYDWNDGYPNFDNIIDIYNKTLNLQNLVYNYANDLKEKMSINKALENVYFNSINDFNNFHKKDMIKFIGGWNELKNRVNELASLTQSDFESINTNNWLIDMDLILNRWGENLHMLRDWTIYNNFKYEALKLNLIRVIEFLEENPLQINEETLIPSFNKSLFNSLINRIIYTSKILQSFSGPIFENNVNRFRDLSLNFEDQTKEALIAKLSSLLPNVNRDFASSSEVAILKRAIKSGGRGLSLRKLFETIPNLIRRLAPCMLMSPISVAQYLDPSYPNFDLVIFDEASQIETADAVGAIARGDDLIVVGDPKQLPPTSFFATNQKDDENMEYEDLESILDDCMVLSIPETHLLWHYRSRHESLIAFSNRQFYNNSLYTFPSPREIVSEVSFIKVNGYYDRSNTRQNHEEAEAIIKEIENILRDPKRNHQSIGVVTFSQVQQNLIEDKLQDLFTDDYKLDELNSKHDEPIFIKNLENVQGDERDIILFSVGYGPDKEGRLTMNFGPLNREGGWRRLNVAITRARICMKIFSTIEPEQIDLSKTQAEGLISLKSFLEYAKHGSKVLHLRSDTKSKIPTSLENNIASKLEKRGYKLRLKVGSSAFKVNIAVMNPEKPGEYLLGILIDDEIYGETSRAKDRNVSRKNVLKSLGWEIYELWLLDWYQNPDREIDNVINIIDNIKGKERKETMRVSEIQKNRPLKIEKLKRIESHLLENKYEKEYETCYLDKVEHYSEDFHEPKYNQFIYKQINSVVIKEGPIELDSLIRSVINSWDISRLTQRNRERVEEIINQIGYPISKTFDKIFIWPEKNNPEEYNIYRTPKSDKERRAIELIPKEEVAVLIRVIVKDQIGLSQECLYQEITKSFGFARTTANMKEYIDYGIKYAEEKGWIIIENGQIR